MSGKEKCEILKKIREKIAKENDIPLNTRECSFEGECKGTCPRCEQELKYLENQLKIRKSIGKRAAVTAVCASLALSAAGCSPADAVRKAAGPVEPESIEESVELSGEVAWPEEAECQLLVD